MAVVGVVGVGLLPKEVKAFTGVKVDQVAPMQVQVLGLIMKIDRLGFGGRHGFDRHKE